KCTPASRGSRISRWRISAARMRISSATRSCRPCVRGDGGRLGLLTRGSLERGRSGLLDEEGLDHVADLDVVVALQADAALEARGHLAHVLLEATQRGETAVPDD